MAEKTLDNIDHATREMFDKADYALQRGNIDYAIEMLMQCVRTEPNFIKGRQILRAVQMKRAEGTGGFSRAFSAARTTPALTKAKMLAGKDPVEAMNLVEQILCDDPRNGGALLLLAEAATTANFPETTVQTLEHYTKLHPRDTKTLHWLARSYTTIERHDLARDVYERILKIHPNDFEAQKGVQDAVAHGAMQKGGWEDAESYRDVIKDKGEAVALEQESRVVRADDMIENLIKENLEKLAQDPKNPVIQRELGKLYGQKGDFGTALQYLEKIFNAEGGADPSLEEEISQVRANRIEARRDALKEQLASKPANAAELEKQIADIEQEYDKLLVANAERLVERYPNDLLYRYDLGALYFKMGNFEGAIEQFQKSAGQPQRRVASYNYLGLCFHKLGHYDLAVDQYTKASEESPSMDALKKDILYNLGMAYEAMGQHEKAIAEYKKIASVDFSFRDVREKITRKPPK
jgi:tetratricopeptide (TPR) repeat protein